MVGWGLIRIINWMKHGGCGMAMRRLNLVGDGLRGRIPFFDMRRATTASFCPHSAHILQWQQLWLPPGLRRSSVCVHHTSRKP